MTPQIRYHLIKETALISGTFLVVFLWLAGRYSDRPELSLVFLGIYALLDQLNSRLWVSWQETLLKEQLNGPNQGQPKQIS